MSEESGAVMMEEGGTNMSRLFNYLIILLLVALVALGAVLVYTYFIKDDPVDPTLERALEGWKQAVRDDPSNSLARANLGATYLDMGKIDEAIEELETALEMVPDSFSYTLELGYAYREKGDFEKSIDLFVESADLTPAGEKYIAYYEAAVTARDAGDMEAAKGFVAQSIEDNDMIWNSHVLLAELYEAEGDLEQALAEFEAALKFNPNDVELQRSVERVSADR